MGMHDTHSGAQPHHDDMQATTATDVPSRFEHYGGYYSVRFGGVEVARFAPSNRWSDYAQSMENDPAFSYAFVSTDAPNARPASDEALIEGRARLHDIEDYEGPDADADPIDRAFWRTDTAKAAVGLMFINNRHQPHLLLNDTIVVTREDDFMVARMRTT